MADYIERDAVCKLCRESCFSECHLCFVKDVPAADVVEVVRCKDCGHGELCENMAGAEYVVCEVDDYQVWKPDGFCSYGERRTDDGEA